MSKRRSRKGNLTRNQKYALIAAAVLIAAIMVYGDSITGFATDQGTITFTITGTTSFTLTDDAATITSGGVGETKNTSTGSNEMYMTNTGNTDLICTIQSDEASYAAIFGGSGAGSPTFKFYTYDKESSSAGTHTAPVSAKDAMTYSGGSAAAMVDDFQFEDSQDEVYIGFEHKIATDAVVASADTTTVTVTCIAT